MNGRRLILVNFATGVVVWTLFAQVNHYLSDWHISLFVGGLLVAFPALRFSYRDGWKVVLPLGLWCDASSAVHFGLHAILFLTAYTIIFHYRDRFPREETPFGILVALLANAGIFVVLTAGLIARNPFPLAALPAILIDLIVSELFVAVAATWYFALTERALEIAGVDLRRGQRGLL